MRFEVGKNYEHVEGGMIEIVAKLKTTYCGKGLLAKDKNGEYFVVGEEDGATLGWEQINKNKIQQKEIVDGN